MNPNPTVSYDLAQARIAAFVTRPGARASSRAAAPSTPPSRPVRVPVRFRSSTGTGLPQPPAELAQSNR